MKVTSKGQVTIPIELRRKRGIRPDMNVEFEETERGPRIVVRPEDRAARARRMTERIRGSANLHMSTDELMALTRGEDDGAVLI